MTARVFDLEVGALICTRNLNSNSLCTGDFSDLQIGVRGRLRVRVLRAMPTIVIAHTFCASGDTRVFLSVMLSNAVIFFARSKTIRRK